jgi:hypothetical protein
MGDKAADLISTVDDIKDECIKTTQATLNNLISAKVVLYENKKQLEEELDDMKQKSVSK